MTQTERAIRAFAGPPNAALRARIRACLAGPDPASVLRLRLSIPLTALGEANLQAVWDAWQADNPVLGGPSSRDPL